MDQQAEEIVQAYHEMWREWLKEYKIQKERKRKKQESKQRRDQESNKKEAQSS